jgi:hypothetical protein
LQQASALNCPSCGGPVSLENRFVKMVICGYCGNTLAVDQGRLDPTGHTAKLADLPSRFRVGASGRLRGRPFHVLGRVRYQDEDCTWDEWSIAFKDGSVAWLEEEEGQLTLSSSQPLTSEVPEFAAARVGSTVQVNGQPFFITERCTATVAGAEGQLTYRVAPGRQVRFLDGNMGGRTAAIEYGEDEIEFTIGDPLRHADIVLDGEAA